MKGSLVGHIIGGPADPDYDGAVLTADVAVGDTVLHVDDTADFDEDAAKRDAVLFLGVDLATDGNPDPSTGAALAYSTCDDNTQTVTLTSASTVTASTGDRIYLKDPVSGGCVGTTEVQVAVDNGDQTGDALSAYVDVSLIEAVGDIDLTDLAVDLDDDEDGQLFVAGFPGLSQPQGAVKFYQDETIAAGAGGTVTLNLTYQPIVNSEHLYIGGVYQRGAAWSRDKWTVTIPDTTGRLKSGNKVAMEYAYRNPATAPVPTYSGPSSHALSGTWGSYPSSFITSQALPVGTQVGDLLVAVAAGDGGGGVTISDPRMTTVWFGGNRIVSVGYATDLTAMVCHVGGQAGSLDQFAGIEVLSVHGNGTDPLNYDPARLTVADLASGGTVPTVSGTGHGVITAIVAAYGNTVTINMATYMPAYTDWGGAGFTSVIGNFGYRASAPPPTQTNPTNAQALVALIGLR